MGEFGFIEQAYSTAGGAPGANRCVNCYYESVNNPGGESTKALMGTPGLAVFAALPTQPVQCEWEAQGRAFVVSGWTLYELLATGLSNRLGLVAPGSCVVMADNGLQLVVANGAPGNGYTFDLTTLLYAPIMSPGWLGADDLWTVDGYIGALVFNSQKFTISGLFDATTWGALNFGAVTGAPENVVGTIVLDRQVWFMADDHGEVYYDSGASLFPITRLEGGYIEEGLAARATLIKADNTVFWLGQSKLGDRIAWRANGYTPNRISTSPLEAIWAAYPRVDDASSYPYRENGHTFIRFDFPSALGGLGESWLYDVGEKKWHNRAFWDITKGQYQAHLGRTHMFVFGLHLVGDYQSGNVYTQSLALRDDAGARIRRLRSSPSLSKEDKFIKYPSLRLMVKTGGLDIAPGATPQITMRCSNDGGYTWGVERTIPLGRLGDYGATTQWRRTGRARRRCYEIVCDETIFIAFLNAFI